MWQEVVTTLIILAAIAYIIVQARSRRRRSGDYPCADGCRGCPHARAHERDAETCRGPAGVKGQSTK